MNMANANAHSERQKSLADLCKTKKCEAKNA